MPFVSPKQLTYPTLDLLMNSADNHFLRTETGNDSPEVRFVEFKKFDQLGMGVYDSFKRYEFGTNQTKLGGILSGRHNVGVSCSA